MRHFEKIRAALGALRESIGTHAEVDRMMLEREIDALETLCMSVERKARRDDALVVENRRLRRKVENRKTDLAVNKRS